MLAMVLVLPIKHYNFCMTVMNQKLSDSIGCNEKVFPLAGYSLNIHPVQMPNWKYFFEDMVWPVLKKIDSLII